MELPTRANQLVSFPPHLCPLRIWSSILPIRPCTLRSVDARRSRDCIESPIMAKSQFHQLLRHRMPAHSSERSVTNWKLCIMPMQRMVSPRHGLISDTLIAQFASPLASRWNTSRLNHGRRKPWRKTPVPTPKLPRCWQLHAVARKIFNYG